MIHRAAGGRVPRPVARTRPFRWTLAIAALGGLTVAASAGQADRADRVLDRALRDLVAMDGGPPGAIAIVQRDGRRSVHTAGVMDVARRRPIGSRDHMRIASVAKAFSGAVALALVDRGILSLDDTLGERLPELPAAWSAVTLRQLLNHTSGLPDYSASPAFRAAVGADPTAYFAPDELLPFVYDEDLLFMPGTRYAYSNSDNIAVGLIVERATGLSYAEALEREVLAPIRARETSLPVDVELPAPFVHGYVLADDGSLEDVSEELNPSGAWASGGIVSTPADLNRFVRALLGRRFFGRRVQAEQLDFVPGGTSDPPGPGENAAGLAVFRYTTRCGTVYGHTGSFPGYTQLAVASRDGSRSATVSINLQIPPEDSPLLAALREVWVHAVCAVLAPVRSGHLRRALPSGGDG